MLNDQSQNALIEPETPEGFRIIKKGARIRIFEEINRPENAETLTFHIRFAQPVNPQ